MKTNKEVGKKLVLETLIRFLRYFKYPDSQNE